MVEGSAVVVDLCFVVAIVFFVLSLIRSSALQKIPWVVLGHIFVAGGLLLAL